MKKIQVELTNNPYPIYVGSSALSLLPKVIQQQELSRKILLIVDENVNRYHSDKLKHALKPYKNSVNFYVLKQGEKNKSYIELNKIYSFLLDNNYGRDSLIIVAGGGVAGDLGAFAASTFMRGVQLINVPTTLLAAVDSSIGGKTGINFNDKKNMIGTFYQPNAVIVDTEFLQTLPKEELSSGLGEVIKYAFLANDDFFSFLDKNINKVYDFEPRIIEEIILKSALIKAGVVAQDEREGGIRKILNLGHTFAHAFESDLNFRIKHGEAVVAGIIAALTLSAKKGILTKKRFEKFLSLPGKIKLTKKLRSFDTDNVFSLMHSDKKNRNGKIKFVLLSAIGKLIIDVEAGRDDVYYSLNMTKELLNSPAKNFINTIALKVSRKS